MIAKEKLLKHTQGQDSTPKRSKQIFQKAPKSQKKLSKTSNQQINNS